MGAPQMVRPRQLCSDRDAARTRLRATYLRAGAWTHWHKTVPAFLALPPGCILFCGMALGHADEDASINRWRSPREPADAFATFHGVCRWRIAAILTFHGRMPCIGCTHAKRGTRKGESVAFKAMGTCNAIRMALDTPYSARLGRMPRLTVSTRNGRVIQPSADAARESALAGCHVV
jgi:hypothetical protein